MRPPLPPRPQILTLPTLLTLARVAAVPALIAAWFSSAPLAAAACTALFVGASLTDYLDGYLARKMVGGWVGGCLRGCWAGPGRPGSLPTHPARPVCTPPPHPPLPHTQNASSAFGAFLDPVADKLMVAAVMILMCTRPLPPGLMAGNTWVMPLATCGELAAATWLRGILAPPAMHATGPAPAPTRAPSPTARSPPGPRAAVVIGREITMSALREWAAALGPEAHSAVAVSWVGKWKTAAQMTSLALLLVGHQAAAGGAATVPPALLQVAGTAGVPLLGVAAALTLWSLADYFAALWRFF